MQNPKIGIIVDDFCLKYPYSEILKKLVNHVESPLVVIHQNISKNTFFSFKDLLFRLVRKFESFFYPQLKETSKIDLNDVFVIEVSPIVSSSGFVYKYSKSDVDKISNFDLDIIIRAGSGILSGDILNKASKYGIISLHHGDPDFYRGGPPGFWEIINNERESSFIVQILNESLDGGQVLYKDSILTSRIYSKNLFNLYSTSVDAFLGIIINQNFNDVNKAASKIYSSPLYKNPNNYITLRYIYSVFCFLFASLFNKIFNRDWQWQIHFNFFSSNIELRKNSSLVPPQDRFYADPFPVVYKDSNYIFFEEFLYSERIGKISCYDVNNSQFYRNIITEDFHLSFPFVFEFNSIFYMVVESSQNLDLRLYQCEEMPFRWTFKQQLITGDILIDPIVFTDNNELYLVASHKKTSRSEVTGLNVYKLVFQSDKFVLNKIPFVDSHHCSSRNGGYFNNNGKHYRVVQNSDFYTYGKSISLLEFTISGNSYSERFYSEISSYPSRDFKGLHTFNKYSNFIVFDSVRRIYVHNKSS